GFRQAVDEPCLKRPAARHYDNWDGTGSLLGGADGGAPDHQHIHLEPDEVSRQLGELLESVLGKAILHGQILALHPAKVAQAVPESFQTLGALRIECGHQHTNAGDFRWLLRHSSPWDHEAKSTGEHDADRAEPQGDGRTSVPGMLVRTVDTANRGLHGNLLTVQDFPCAPLRSPFFHLPYCGSSLTPRFRRRWKRERRRSGCCKRSPASDCSARPRVM